MKGFASTIILLSIVSLVTTQVNLQNELQSSMFEQKANIQLMQQTNEKIYNIERSFEKTVKEAHTEAKAIKLALKLTGTDVIFAIEPYVCSRVIDWFNGKYSMRTAVVDRFGITNIEFTEEDFDSDKLKIAKEQFGEINKNNLEFPSLYCLAILDEDFLNVDHEDFGLEISQIEVGWNDILKVNSISSIKKTLQHRIALHPIAPSFVFEDEILGQKITVVIPGGTEI